MKEIFEKNFKFFYFFEQKKYRIGHTLEDKGKKIHKFRTEKQNKPTDGGKIENTATDGEDDHKDSLLSAAYRETKSE
jgi:hypothetical protein